MYNICCLLFNATEVARVSCRNPIKENIHLTKEMFADSCLSFDGPVLCVFFTHFFVVFDCQVDVPGVCADKVLKAAMKHIEIIAKAREKGLHL